MTSDEALGGRLARRASSLLLWLGIALLFTWAYVQVRAGVFQLVEERRFQNELGAARSARSESPVGPYTARTGYAGGRETSEGLDRPGTDPQPVVGERLARLVIPRLNIKAVVVEGVGDEELRLAVGHVPGTGLPGREGNIALAAHRDTFFRGLGKLQAGDVIRLTTLTGDHEYEVEWTKVVAPKDVWVMDDVGGQVLTLITCFPFHYVGSAPDRYIVRARLVPATS